MKYNCRTCGKAIEGTVYTDDSTGLTLSHGAVQCRECYIKSGHPECLKCESLLSAQFKYCPWCGLEQK
mgnify:FL=1